jgi:hypothetical protein
MSKRLVFGALMLGALAAVSGKAHAQKYAYPLNSSVALCAQSVFAHGRYEGIRDTVDTKGRAVFENIYALRVPAGDTTYTLRFHDRGLNTDRSIVASPNGVVGKEDVLELKVQIPARKLEMAYTDAGLSGLHRTEQEDGFDYTFPPQNGLGSYTVHFQISDNLGKEYMRFIQTLAPKLLSGDFVR